MKISATFSPMPKRVGVADVRGDGRDDALFGKRQERCDLSERPFFDTSDLHRLLTGEGDRLEDPAEAVTRLCA